MIKTVTKTKDDKAEKFPLLMRHKVDGEIAIFTNDKEYMVIAGNRLGHISLQGFMPDWEPHNEPVTLVNC